MIESACEWLNDDANCNTIGWATLLILVVPSITAFFYFILGGEKTREWIAEWLKADTWREAYGNLLIAYIKTAHYFFGPPFSSKAFRCCLVLAYGYASTYQISQTLYQAAAINENYDQAIVSFLFGFVLLLFALFIFRWRNNSNIRMTSCFNGTTFITGTAIVVRDMIIGFAMGGIGIAVANLLAHWMGRPEAVAEAIVLLKVIVQGGSASEVFAENKSVFTQSLVVIGGVGLAAATAFLGTVWISGTQAIVTVTIAAACVLLLFVNPFVAVLFLFVYMFLPMLNAVFDFPSWWVTRKLIDQLIADTRRTTGLSVVIGAAKHIAIDLGLAIFFLLGLVASFSVLANIFQLPGVWNRAALMAGLAPFSSTGLMLTFMLLSTLVPTFIHLLFAVLALSTYVRPARIWVSKFLTSKYGGGEPLSRLIVSSYLTLCSVVAICLLWACTVGFLKVADSLVRIFSSESRSPEFWNWLLSTADFISTSLGF